MTGLVVVAGYWRVGLVAGVVAGGTLLDTGAARTWPPYAGAGVGTTERR